MRAGAAHKRDVLPHSISGLRSIRRLAPWAPARAVVIGWTQRLGARWHSGRQLLGTEAEQNEYNRNINGAILQFTLWHAVDRSPYRRYPIYHCRPLSTVGCSGSILGFSLPD